MQPKNSAPESLRPVKPFEKNGAEQSGTGADTARPPQDARSNGSGSAPQLDAARAQAGSVAPDGATLRRGPKLSKAANVRLQFARTYRQLVTGEIDERKATARARILEGALAAIESTKLEARLHALEKERKAQEEAKV